MKDRTDYNPKPHIRDGGDHPDTVYVDTVPGRTFRGAKYFEAMRFALPRGGPDGIAEFHLRAGNIVLTPAADLNSVITLGDDGRRMPPPKQETP